MVSAFQRMRGMRNSWWRGSVLAVATVLALVGAAREATAQGVTTGSLGGVVTNASGAPVAGASVIAIHTPSGTNYETTTREDGRYFLPNMRVGGPYVVTVTYVGGGNAFEPYTNENVTVNLGVTTDVNIEVKAIAVEESVTVTASTDTVFSTQRTGAATTVSRDMIQTLPNVSNRLENFTRLTPQASGTSFVGQDNRLNNITVDGSYFNNSFGLGGAPGDRTGVAPISPQAVEQIQVNVAPFDVRQGNFVGAGVNTVTRSGGNQFHGSLYRQFRDDSMVGTQAGNNVVNVGTFEFANTGGWVSGPIWKNKAFFFFNVEDESLTQPGTTWRANNGGEAAGGGITRVLKSDLDNLSAFLGNNFGYQTGGYEGYDFETPARRYLIKGDYNANASNKITFRYTHLDSITDVLASNSASLGFGNRQNRQDALNFANSNYQIKENIRSGVGEWNATFGNTMANSLIVGYTYQDESRSVRGDGKLFPFVDILDAGTTYTSFGFEPFTPNNELRYKTFQVQDSFTKFARNHTLTFGGTAERYESENVFFPGSQSVYSYNSLADFYLDARDYLANPNRTTSPVNLRRFQVRWSNIPGQTKPVQPLEVWYTGAYAQDEWAVRDNVKITAGIRLDVPRFGDTGYQNANADALVFRDENGQPVQYQTAKLPDPKILWSPRVGFNWGVDKNRNTQVRGGTGIFTGRPAYVWISNQIGNTGVLTGFEELNNVTNRPFNPNPDAYKPTNVTGAPAGSYELALTDPDFKFPQLWRTNVAVDQRLWWGMIGTVEYIYNSDVNGIYYINANLPAAQAAFTGADARPRWTSNRIYSNVSNAVVLKNQNVGDSWNFATTLAKNFTGGFLKGAYAYGEAKNTVDPGSIAFGSWNGNAHAGDPNNPGLGYAAGSPGHRFFLTGSWTKEWFKFGGTTFSAFWESRTNGATTYTFAGDLNGDGGVSNDLIYVPRDVSEMNFQPYTAGGVLFTAAQQAAAWDAYISQDEYLNGRRGEYAERGAVFLPLVHRLDFSVQQDFFVNIKGRRHGFQVRADILNFGNLLNEDWGVGQRLINTQPLIVPTAAQGGAVDAQGRAQYRLRAINNELMTRTLEPTANLSDTYRFQIMLMYRF
ncbi:cell envelope biogenesis protein OmpA [Luteitalea sp. TBR-22]|uniref:TonB-dependent receptor n=1 Tax=Luteitalea sp. TBR-22 TaxID=2802971 RepID=UPI001AF7F1F8|nr:carboxypeptidase regulatory-like domain-containing protein [Luteitalea sp. TBR-22]BCS35574.1 cell envelope biogenesis protein OmpA [Luteitalea sp. TBR-22]